VDVFPNPARDVLNVKINANDSNKARIILTDLTGKQLILMQQDLKPGINYLTVQNPGLRGMYILTIVADGLSESRMLFFE
jgi:hypothetical protein